MLNELFGLAQSLDDHGLLHSSTHPNVGKVGQCFCLLIELNKQGKPVAIRLLPKSETAQLWKHSKKNHNSFPAIRVQASLLALEESSKFVRKLEKMHPDIKTNRIYPDAWTKLKLQEKRALLLSLDFSNLNPDSRDIKISEWSRNELSVVLSTTSPPLAALKMLLERFPTNAQQDDFYASLSTLLRSKIVECTDVAMLDFLAEMLTGKYDTQKKKFVAGCMTYFDIYETAEVTCTVRSADTANALIRLLNKEHAHTDAKLTEVCALTGKKEELIGDTYPNPKLPLLGLTYLYSKKADTPCLTRYSMHGVDAFSASKSAVKAINDAIAFLTVPEKEKRNKTWGTITDSNRDKPDLLLAYLNDDPQNDALLAQILGDPTDYTEAEKESAYAALCRQVIGGIKPVLEKNPDSKVNLIILETLDPGRKQIVYGNSFSARQFEKNILSWAEMSNNHPPIIIRAMNRKEIREYRPICPGPNEICKLMKLNYSTSGNARPQKAGALTLQEIYRLYMPQGKAEAECAEFAKDVLAKVMQRTSPLLGAIGQEKTMSYALSGFKQTDIEKACMAISFISILLFRLGIKKEEYMMDISFQIGQFLQLTDMLHKAYCIQVRNSGDKNKPLPPQLIGNELLLVAMENPNEALKRLGERIRIYLAWADTAVGEDSGLAKWILARYGEVCSALSVKEIPNELDTAKQAQVLLGYLATIPYEKKEEKSHERAD